MLGSVTSRCSYPDVLRGNPKCEASGTMFQTLVASTGQGLGEDERVNASETSVQKFVNGKLPTKLIGSNQNGEQVGPRDSSAFGDVQNSCRTTDVTQPVRIFDLINWVSPMHPALGRYPDRKEGGGCRGYRMLEKAKAEPVMGLDRVSDFDPTRKGADFQRVSTVAKLRKGIPDGEGRQW